MRRTGSLLFTTCLLVLLVTVVRFSTFLKTEPSIWFFPAISFKQCTTLDSLLCPPWRREFLASNLDAVFDTKLDRFQKIWDVSGPELLVTSTEMTGQSFVGAKRTVKFSRCYVHFGWSSPPILPGYLLLVDRENSESEKKRTQQLLDLTFHELLHPFILWALSKRLLTPMILKYKHESPLVLLHLYLFAMQKSVYLRLGQSQRWDLVKISMKKALPAYSRAIAIVEKEGKEKFLEELLPATL